MHHESPFDAEVQAAIVVMPYDRLIALYSKLENDGVEDTILEFVLDECKRRPEYAGE